MGKQIGSRGAQSQAEKRPQRPNSMGTNIRMQRARKNVQKAKQLLSTRKGPVQQIMVSWVLIYYRVDEAISQFCFTTILAKNGR